MPDEVKPGVRLEGALRRLDINVDVTVDRHVTDGLRVFLRSEDAGQLANQLADLLIWWAAFTPTQRQQILTARVLDETLRPRKRDPEEHPAISRAEDRARGWD